LSAGLLNKIYTTTDEWQKPIDYSAVDPIIDAEIKDSLDYLKFEVEN